MTIFTAIIDSACHHRVSFSSGMIISALAKHYLPSASYSWQWPQEYRNALRYSYVNGPKIFREGETYKPVFFNTALAELWDQMDPSELLNIWKIPCVLIDLIEYSIFAGIDSLGKKPDYVYPEFSKGAQTAKYIISAMFFLLKLPFYLLQLPFEAANYSSDIIRNWKSASTGQKVAAVALSILNLVIAIGAIFTIVGIKTHTIPIMAKMAHTFSGFVSRAAGWLNHTLGIGRALTTIASRITLYLTPVRNLLSTVYCGVRSALRKCSLVTDRSRGLKFVPDSYRKACAFWPAAPYQPTPHQRTPTQPSTPSRQRPAPAPRLRPGANREALDRDIATHLVEGGTLMLGNLTVNDVYGRAAYDARYEEIRQQWLQEAVVHHHRTGKLKTYQTMSNKTKTAEDVFGREAYQEALAARRAELVARNAYSTATSDRRRTRRREGDRRQDRHVHSDREHG